MKKIALVTVMVLVSACANRPNFTTAHAVGTAVGAATGGIIGYQFGGGLTQTLFATAGAIGGGAAGYVLGPRLWPSDRAEYERTAKWALAGAPDGEVVTWSNPDTGNGGIIRPTRSFVGPAGDFCRQYRASVAFRDGVESGAGLACRHGDGEWRLIEDHFG